MLNPWPAGGDQGITGGPFAWMLLPQNLEHLASKIRKSFLQPRGDAKEPAQVFWTLANWRTPRLEQAAAMSMATGVGVRWRGGPRSWRCAQARAAPGRGTQARTT